MEIRVLCVPYLENVSLNHSLISPAVFVRQLLHVRDHA